MMYNLSVNSIECIFLDEVKKPRTGGRRSIPYGKNLSKKAKKVIEKNYNV